MRSNSQVTDGHKSDVMLISDIRNEQSTRGSKLVEIEMTDDATKHFHKLQQKVFLAELDQMCSPLSRSLDHLGQTFACSKCDPRMSHLSKIPIEANIELRDCIRFLPPDAFHHGRFEYNLLFSGMFQYLPLEKMKNDAYHRTKKLVHKVNLHNAAVAKLASLRLQQLYSRSDVAWVTPYDETQSMVFLPLHCVVKPSSCSTQARICIAPNVSYNTPVGPVSYNSALKNISSSQPRFYRFLLQHQTALAFAVADVSQQFNRCHFSRPSSLLNVTLAMRSRRNLPTYCVDDCDDVSLHPLRHKVCGFGGKQTPQVAQYCQQNSVKVFKSHHPKLSVTDEFLTEAVESVLYNDTWMDDMFLYVGLSLLFKWMDISKVNKPTWSENFDTVKLKLFMSQLKSHADNLLILICAQLTKILQFSGFKIKHFKTKCPTQQKKLDLLIAEQRIGLDNDNFIEVKKPSQLELHNQLRFLSPHTEFPPYEPESEREGVPHLGLLYNEGEVKLLKNTLSFVYSCAGKKVKSPEFKNFDDFISWHKRVKPQYSRRSLFSLVASTQDATGRHLALYRARMKLLIRAFLLRKPLSGWECLVNIEEERQLLFNIEIYFHLVQKTVYEPNLAKYCTKRSILAFSDGSDSLYAISISMVYSYCVNGITKHQATHLCLIPYSAHVQMINILWIELAGFAKLLAELAGYLIELKSLGVEIPPKNIFLASDSMVLIKLLRSKVTHLQKSSSHKCAKILIQMNTLALNSFDHLFWADQKVVNFYPDFISKKGKIETCQSVLKTYDRLFDFDWVTSGPLESPPGLHANLPNPKKSELEELKASHVLESEWENFCREQILEQQDDIMTLSAAARCTSNPACSVSCKKPDTQIAESALKLTPKPPPKDGSHTVSPECVQACTKDHTEWKKTLTHLIQRKFSYGFNKRGCIGILQKCLEFGLKLRCLARLGETGRKERQKKREREYRDRPVETFPLLNPFQQGHELIAKAIDPLTLHWGQLDEHFQPPAAAGGDLPEDLEHQGARHPQKVDASRIFHLMTTSFQSKDRVRYFSNLTHCDIYGQEVSLLIGRRQRDNFEQGNEGSEIQQTRLRLIEPCSILEELILFAAHQASFSNLSKAKVSIFALNVYVVNLDEKLRKLQLTCSCCCLVRAQRLRWDDLVQNSQLGPSSQLFRVKKWQENVTFHMIDLAGPARTYMGNVQNHRKFFILLGLQLPIKRLICVPIKDYSAQSLYLGLLEYSVKVGGRLEIVASDSGSQIGPYQNEAMGYHEEKMDREVPVQTYNWMQMVLGKRRKQLAENNIFLKIVSGAHKHLAPIESCVATLKYTLASLNKRLSTPMDIFHWNYVLRLTERTVLTRPLAASKGGRFWTPACLLNLMGEQGRSGDVADFRPQARADTVVDQLERFEQNMIKLKTEVAHILVDSLIMPSFCENMTREERVKRRTQAREIKLSDIFLCPVLLAKSFHMTKSLLRLVYINDAETGGVFAKTGKHRQDRLVTRDFSYLYYICKGTRDTILGARWRPTFNVQKIFKEIAADDSMCFEADPSEKEIKETLRSQSEENAEYHRLMGNNPHRLEPLSPELEKLEEEGGAGADEGGDDGGEGEEEDRDEDQDPGEQVSFSRYGRKLRKTKFFGI